MDEERGWGWVFGGLGGAGSRKDIEVIFDEYTVVNIQKAIENGPVKKVDLPMKNGWNFQFAMLVSQRYEMIIDDYAR